MMLAAGIFPGMKPNERKWSSRLEKVIKFGKNATGKPQFDGKNMERVLQRFLEKDLKLDPGIALLEDSACKTYAIVPTTYSTRVLTEIHVASYALPVIRLPVRYCFEVIARHMARQPNTT
jgi:hypothetical protein